MRASLIRRWRWFVIYWLRRCPFCYRKSFFLSGPEDGITFNLKCRHCTEYLRVKPMEDHVEKIDPGYRW